MLINSSKWSDLFLSGQGNFSRLFLHIDDVLRILCWTCKDQRTPAERVKMLELVRTASAIPEHLDSVVPMQSLATVTLEDDISFLGSARLGPGPYSNRVARIREHYFQLPKRFFGGGVISIYSVELLDLLSGSSRNLSLPDLVRPGSCVILLRPLADNEREHGCINRGYWNKPVKSTRQVDRSDELISVDEAFSLFASNNQVSDRGSQERGREADGAAADSHAVLGWVHTNAIS